MHNPYPRALLTTMLAITLIAGLHIPLHAQSGTANRAMLQPAPEPAFEISFAGTTAIGPSSTWLWEGGFGFSYLLRDHIRIGVEQLGYSSTTLLSGTRSGISIAPNVEYHTAIASPLELAVGAGVPLQFRFGANLDTKLGTAPFVRVGIDLRTSESFSFGLLERISYVVSDAYIMSEHGLPNGATIFATGLAFKFHF